MEDSNSLIVVEYFNSLEMYDSLLGSLDVSKTLDMADEINWLEVEDDANSLEVMEYSNSFEVVEGSN